MLSTSIFNQKNEEDSLNERLKENNQLIKYLESENDEIISKLAKINADKEDRYKRMVDLINEYQKSINKFSSMQPCLWDNVKPGTPMSMSCPCLKCTSVWMNYPVENMTFTISTNKLNISKGLSMADCISNLYVTDRPDTINSLK